MRKPSALVHATYSISSLNVVCIGRDSVAGFSGTGHACKKTISSHLHTSQHLEIRNQNIFTIVAEQALKAQAASARVFARMAENAHLSTLIKSLHKIPAD